jgi:hypothetical protein
MKFSEFGTQIKSLEQLRIDGLKAAKEKAGQALQAEKQRQKVAKAQQALNAAKLANPTPLNVQQQDVHAMRIVEVTNPLHTYTAAVRVSVGGSALIVRTQVQADGITQARALLQYLYGPGNVLSVT